MTASPRPLSNCPEPCACQPCQLKRACLQKVMTLMARSSPALFELLEIWALEDHDDRKGRQHEAGLRDRLVGVPRTGRCHRSSVISRFSAVRRPLPGPPGG